MPNSSWNKLVVVGALADVRRFRVMAERRADTGKRRSGKHNTRPLKVINALDLDLMRPQTEEELNAFARTLGDVYWDPKWNAWDVNVGRIFTRAGISKLEYSFMTAWCEPIGPIAYASQSHPLLCFVLAGVEISNGEFTSSLIRRGWVKFWTMPERASDKLARFEQFEGEEGDFYCDYQPSIMRGLLAHWDSQIMRLLAKPAAVSRSRIITKRDPARRGRRAGAKAT